MVLIGVLSAIWLRLTGKPASLIRRTRSRGDTEPNSWPASEAWRSTVKLLPLSWSATPAASLFMAAERACSSAFMLSNRVRFSSVARRALPRGNRKLRANPSLTRTTSPIWPSRATRSSRITSISASPSPLDRALADHVRQQPEETGTFDGLRQFALALRRDSGDAARHDFTALRDEPLQELDVLVVDLRRIGAGERAALATPEERTAAAAHLWGHGHDYSSVAASGSLSRGRRSRSRGRSPRSPRSPRSKRSPRSPRRSSRSRSRSARRIMADGPASCSSTRMVR